MTTVIPSAARPIVSVVILAWRLADPLIAAIRSIVDSTDAPSFEVIVVFNGVKPELRHMFDREIEGASVIALEHNVGYGDGCNRAADVARGEFLLFLNDDAQLEPDALRSLVLAMDQGARPEPIGAVAALLLNPDGTVQEAGSRVLATAGTVQAGKGMTIAQADAAGLLRRRSIDYGSGAAVLVRRDLFTALGGYDRRYRPAYFEDVDLAFRMRAAGYDIVFDHRAVAVHASGASTADDHRFREFAGDHAGRAFIERWQDVLSGAAKSDDPVDAIVSVPRSSTPLDLENPPPLAVGESPADIALQIADDYAAWLNAALDRCTDSHANLDADLQHARSEWSMWHDRAQEFGARADELNRRLLELEQRNLFGVARWRVGLARQRRRQRRVQ